LPVTNHVDGGLQLVRIPPRCIDIVEVADAVIDGTLSATDHDMVLAHLVVCTGCLAYVQQMRTVVLVLASLDVTFVNDPDRLTADRLSADDARLVAGLRGGDERIFSELVDRYHNSLIRVARGYVGGYAIAEEVVQETWIAVIEGIDRFEGRSSLKTWIYRILVYRSRSRGERERRTIPMTDLGGETETGPLVAPERFRGGDAIWAGHWAAPPRRWDGATEERLLAGETRAVLETAVDALPPSQRLVISLRDIQGLTADEVCDLLSISEGNQRVLLHRARAKVREALEDYLDG
jgi:RNA polymerase sigma-70 factor, ECF subfamily